MKVQIAIDGACKNNGKPECASAGAAIFRYIEPGRCLTGKYYVEDTASSNQRGELNALIIALESIDQALITEAQIITDSEYIFNAMTKDWCSSWNNRGWLTANLEPVKNRDLWVKIYDLHKNLVDSNVEINFYHVKGHIITMPQVGTTNTFKELGLDGVYNDARRKYVSDGNQRAIQRKIDAIACSKKNMGFEYADSVLHLFSALNTCADFYASHNLAASLSVGK